MSQLTLLFLIAVAGWLVWRYYGPGKKPAGRTVVRRQAAKPKLEATTLVRDPRTGVYGPASDER